MSSETIVTGIFLISAVIAVGIMINSIFPIIYTTADTFGSMSHQADDKMRTDVKIVNAYASSPSSVKIWLKNVGTAKIHTNMLDTSDIFIGPVGNFERKSLAGLYTIEESTNGYWDSGETLSIMDTSGKIWSEGDIIYFSIVLSNGVTRSEKFTSD